MKKIKSIALAFILMIAGTTISFAQTAAHAHKATHGGIVQTAGDYHIEMLKVANKINFYLLDAKENTISNKAIKGSAVFEFSNNTKTTVPLKNSEKDVFVVDNPKASIFTYCTVSLMVKGKNVTAKFKNDVSQADIEHGHQH